MALGLAGPDVGRALARIRTAYLDGGVAGRDEASFLSVSTGRFDLIAWVRVKSLDELQAFLTGALAMTPGVRKTETIVILDVKRQGFTWFGRL